MTGYHTVKRFALAPSAASIRLPEGWKPFAAYLRPVDGALVVVARSWTRTDGRSEVRGLYGGTDK